MEDLSLSLQPSLSGSRNACLSNLHTKQPRLSLMFLFGSIATSRNQHKIDREQCCPNYQWAHCQQGWTCYSTWIIHRSPWDILSDGLQLLLHHHRHGPWMKKAWNWPSRSVPHKCFLTGWDGCFNFESKWESISHTGTFPPLESQWLECISNPRKEHF